MSVATGIAPQLLLDLDAETFAALERELEERWSNELELAAVQAEIAHAHLLAFVKAHAKKSARLPEPLVIERPKREKKKEDVPTISVLGLAELAGAGVERREVSRGR